MAPPGTGTAVAEADDGWYHDLDEDEHEKLHKDAAARNDPIAGGGWYDDFAEEEEGDEGFEDVGFEDEEGVLDDGQLGRKSRANVPVDVTIGEGEAPEVGDELPDDHPDPEEFVFGNRVPFDEIGIEDERLLRALPKLGFNVSTRCQAASMPMILSEDRRAVVISCETGSGKTLAYLLPAFELVLRSKPRPAKCPYPTALILVPGRELAFQVASVAQQISNAIEGREVTVLGARVNWPDPVPDILVLTPTAAAKGLEPVTSEDEISRREALSRIRDSQLIAMDECDLLLGGGNYTKDVTKLLVALSASYPMRPRQVLPEAQTFHAGGVPIEVLNEKTLEWVKAKGFPQSDGTYNVKYSKEMTMKSGRTGVWERYVRRSRIRGPGIGLLVEYGPRMVLTCATLPTYRKSRFVGMDQDNLLYNSGIGSVSWVIKRWFPSAVRVHSDWIHRRHPSIVKSDWIYIKGEKKGTDRGNVALRIEKVAALLKAQDCGIRTMVFCNNPESCLAAEIAFKNEGLAAVQMHSWLSFDERIDSLKKFATGQAGILICTDMASRGIDLPVCRHVVQLEFAKCTVDYLHRVGRAARAGRMSKSTCLWGDRDKATRDAVMKVPAMGLDGDVLCRLGNRLKMYRQRRKQRKQEHLYGEVRKLARLAREYTANRQGDAMKKDGRMV